MDMITEGSTPIRLFVAMSRAVRDPSLPDGARVCAFKAVEALANHHHLPEFEQHIDALATLIATHAELEQILQPYLPALRALEQRRGVRVPREASAH